MSAFDSFASSILEASLTGAGLVIAIYSLILPISEQILEKRARELLESIEELKSSAEIIGPDISPETIKELKSSLTTIENVGGMPWYLKYGIFLTFISFGMSALMSVLWFSNSQTEFIRNWLSSVFLIALLSFFLTGFITLKDILTSLEIQFEFFKGKSDHKTRIQVDESISKNPSYPREKWEVLWFRYTGSNVNPWDAFLQLTHKLELNFNEDWGVGEVGNTGYMDMIGYRASRTINVSSDGKKSIRIGGDDGVRLYIYNSDFEEIHSVSDGWRDQGYTEYPIELMMKKGEYKLLLEWFERSGAARVSFNLSEES